MNKNIFYKFIAFALTICMHFINLTPIPISAITKDIVLKYDNYDIEYNIVNEWDEFQNIEITITNTSDKTFYNWALGYDAGGEISGLWNGTVYDNNGTNYIIKNAGYNYEILPDESVTFGYTLNNSMYKPKIVHMG
ncbi:MAG: cellulose binding domain-containing protein [Oscillospiraceae bacterium]|nr:cellulose binding domain-containing protein [Oscillospiraceae bacterium]